jgi:tRNA (guanine10-N2)-dimethyltransferase
MTLIAFELSGEHPDIPAAEVVGALEAENIEFCVDHRFDQLLLVDIPNINIPKIRRVVRRLAMTWHIIEVLGISNAILPDILTMAESIVYKTPLSFTYKIRAKKIKRKSPISSEDIEHGIGQILYNKGYRANLQAADTQYRAVLTEGKCIFGVVLESIDRGAFERRNPQNKPFFYPGVLMPRFARALVNIARVQTNSIMIDPYCGTGGIMVEAGLIGTITLGCDVQRKILLGARMNLNFYSVNYCILLQDAGNMALRDGCVDCIVTDPPYGRSALIQAQSLEILMKRSLHEIYRVLRKGGRAVIVSERPIEQWAKQTGFLVIDTYIQKVHRSLTRRIIVLDT